MNLELLEHFQNDLNDLNAFQEFLSMDRVIRNIKCSKQYRKFCVPTRTNKTNQKKRKRRRFNPLLDLTESEFQHSYRFSKDSMRRLLEMVKDDLIEQQQQCTVGESKRRKSQVPVEKQIMAAVRYWGRTEHPEITAQIHGITLHTLMKISKRVAEALSYKASRYIRMPCLLAEKEKVTKGFYDLAHMPQVIGAVNHTQIKCKRLKSEGTIQEQGRQEDVLYVQIVTDANLKIRDLDCHLVKSGGGSKTPSDIFAQSRIKERFEQNEFRGRLLLGDSVLKCSTYLYTPVSYAVTLAEQAFNSSVRLTYEPSRQCLKLWQQRFGILNDEFHGSPTTVRHIVVALVLLHNMAVEWDDTALVAKYVSNMNNSHYLDATKHTDERSRAEFIKNHFNSFIH